MKYVLLVCTLVLALAEPALAHHEAMFGPQSSAVLSPGIFLSALVFDKETGRGDQERRETTTVYSVGFKPVPRQPLSMAFVIPVTFAGGAPDPNQPQANSRGFEDMLISARYRIETPAAARAFGMDESYVMGVGGVELPTGTFDHPFGKGAFGEIAAGLWSLEKRPFATIAYLYYHHRGVYEGVRDSGNMFTGAGLAFTPVDDEEHGKLFSLQLGASYERTFQSEENGAPVLDSGSTGVFLHPGIVFDVSPTVQCFGLISLPLSQSYNSIVDRQRFRFGAGVIWILKHSGT